MKNILRFAAAAVLACTLIACSKSGGDEEPLINNGNPDHGNGSTERLLVTAAVGDETPAPAGAQTRVDADDDGTSKIVFSWNLQDQIYVRVFTSDVTACVPFTAIKVDEQNAKTATFQSPEGYDKVPGYAIWTGSKVFTEYYASQVEGVKATVCSTSEELADKFWMWATYDAQKKNFLFKPMYSILRFDITLPAGQTAINTFRIQMQDGTEAFIPTTRVRVSTDPIEYLDTPTYDFEQTGLNIALDENNHTVVYVPIAMNQAVNISGKKMEIIVNKTLYATQTCGALAIGKTAPIKKTAEKWSDAVYSAGRGTATLPYLISNETNLRALATFVNAGGTHTGKYFAMENDIALTAPATNLFMPIGIGRADSGTPFKGNFDGKNHTISGAGGSIINIQDPGDYASGSGIFGTSIGPISNLTVNSNMNFGQLTGTTAGYIGGVVGYINDASVTNCHHVGEIIVYSTRTNTAASIGGVVGQMFGKGKISNCTQSNGRIGATHASYPFAIGGVCGYINPNGLSGTGAPEMHQCRSTTTLLHAYYSKTPIMGAIIGRIASGVKVYTCNTFSGVTKQINNDPATSAPMIGEGTSAGSDVH